MPRITPADLQRWRQALYEGDPLDASICRRLLEEVDRLRGDLDALRVAFARKAAAALEKRLTAVAAFNSGGCPRCKDAEARAFLAKLKRIADEGKLQ
jgi:hypothetical protein